MLVQEQCLTSQDFKAVVGDFGFALEIPKSESGCTLFTAPLIARTDGYYPPELVSRKISIMCCVQLGSGVSRLTGMVGQNGARSAPKKIFRLINIRDGRGH